MRDAVSIICKVENGNPVVTKAQEKILNDAFASFEGQEMRMSLSSPARERSNRQNSYMWSVVLSMIAAETGNTPEDVHEVMKAKFLPRRFVTIAGVETEVTRSTTDLTTAEMEEYLQRIREFAATELGILVPLPNEAPFNS